MLPGWKTIISTLVTLAYVFYSLNVYSSLETFSEPVFSDKVQCLKFKGVEGARDIARIDNKLYITAAADRVSELCGSGPSGFESGLYSLSMQGSDLYPLVVVDKIEIVNYPEGIRFNPHTVTYDPVFHELLVVNHGYEMGGERVDIFAFLDSDDQHFSSDEDEEDEAKPQQVQGIAVSFKTTVVSPLFSNGLLGSVTALKHPYFLVAASKPLGHSSTGHTPLDDLSHLLSLALFRRWSFLIICSSTGDQSCEKVTIPVSLDAGEKENSTLSFFEVGGLTSDEWDRVWVSDVLSKQVTVLKPISDSGRPEFTIEATLPVPASIFGLTYDPESGHVVASGTPRLLSYMEWPYLKEAGNGTPVLAPSSTFFIDILTFNLSPQLVLSGAMLSVITSASLIPGTNWMMKGSAADDGVLLCEVTGFLPRRDSEEG